MKERTILRQASWQLNNLGFSELAKELRALESNWPPMTELKTECEWLSFRDLAALAIAPVLLQRVLHKSESMVPEERMGYLVKHQRAIAMTSFGAADDLELVRGSAGKASAFERRYEELTDMIMEFAAEGESPVQALARILHVYRTRKEKDNNFQIVIKERDEVIAAHEKWISDLRETLAAKDKFIAERAHFIEELLKERASRGAELERLKNKIAKVLPMPDEQEGRDDADRIIDLLRKTQKDYDTACESLRNAEREIYSVREANGTYEQQHKLDTNRLRECEKQFQQKCDEVSALLAQIENFQPPRKRNIIVDHRRVPSAQKMAWKTFHMGQSIEGALRLPDSTLADMFTKDDGTHPTAEMVREFLKDHLAKGHKVIPLSSECDSFDYVTGCPGHAQARGGDVSEVK